MKYIARTIIALGFIVASYSAVRCQTVQAGVYAINTEYKITNPVEVVQDNQGISATLNVKAYQANEYHKVRLGVVFNYQRDSFGDFPTDTYSFGPELSFRFAKVVQPFAQARFGFDTTYNHDKRFSREYVLGARLIFGNFYVEPLAFGYKRTEGFLSPSTNKLYSGVGINY
jgi:hypothetical protein